MNKNTISEKSIAEREECGSAGQHQVAAMKKGWETETLGELCDIRSGSTPSKGNPAFWDKGVIPWFTIDDMREQGRKISSTHQKITQAALSETSVKLLPEDSVLLCCTASVGEFAITRIPLATNQQFNGLVVKNKNQLDPNFLFHYASTLKDELLGLSGKTTINFIPISRLRDVAIPVPPLAEQQRIVGLLDEAFEGIAIAKANAEKNLQNARALFESHLQSVFTQRGPGWEQKRMVELCSIITCGVASTPKYVDETVGIPFLSAQNVKDGEVLLKKYRFISRGFHEKLTKKNKPQAGDILYSRVGAKFGEAAVVEHDFEFSVYVSLTLIRPIAIKLDNYFLKLYLNSPSIKLLAKKSISSSGVPNLNVKDVREFPISYPSIEKQRRIVSEIKTLQEETQHIAHIFEKKLALLAALKKSLLHQAFSGQL